MKTTPGLKIGQMEPTWQPRERCGVCRRARTTCYCDRIVAFHSFPKFVILINKGEARRAVATGRMSHLCLTNSQLIEGLDFSSHEKVNAILADPGLYPVVLYPDKNAKNVSDLSPAERRAIFPADREPVIFVIDGTWAHARRMRRLSRNLSSLPTICFTPPTLSAFHVRHQPHRHCYSTIESIHHIIDLYSNVPGRPHDNLLRVFNHMVQQQMDFGHLTLNRPAPRGIRTRQS